MSGYHFSSHSTRKFDLILKNGIVVNHEGRGQRDIGIQGNMIAEIGHLCPSKAAEVIDCTGLHILPGVIDSHVHFRDPGATHKETLQTGSHAAVLGGVTAVFDMPNTSPATTSLTTLQDKVERAHHHMHCDFAFWVGATKQNIPIISDLESAFGAAGIKVFMGSSTGDLLLDNSDDIRQVLSQTQRRVAFHCEEEARLKARQNLQCEGDPSSHYIWRDDIAALDCTKRLVDIARQCQAMIHILHISTAQEIDYLRDHKDLVSLEVTPHHLYLNAQDYARLGSLMQMNPPVREGYHQERLWYGLQQSIIDILGSDHAPHHLEEKAKPYPLSPSGIIGVQTSVPLLLNAVNKGKLTLERFVDITSQSVSRLFQLQRKGRIAVGYDADFTIVDLNKEKTLTHSDIVSLPGWTPYDGQKLRGWPVGTIIRGKRVAWENELVTPNCGEAIRFSNLPKKKF